MAVQHLRNLSFRTFLPLLLGLNFSAQAATNAQPRGWAADKTSMGGVINGGEEAYNMQRRPVTTGFTWPPIKSQRKWPAMCKTKAIFC